MLEHDELSKDEQVYAEQTEDLQHIYQISEHDKKALVRIRSRLFAQSTPPASLISTEPGQFQSPQPVIPTPLRSSSTPASSYVIHFQKWKLFLSAMAASLIIVSLVSTLYVFWHFSNSNAKKSQENPVTTVTYAFFDPHMTSLTTGWMLTKDDNGTRIIMRTVNGGQKWDRINITETITYTFFLNDTTAWVIGNTDSVAPFLRTTDGGKTWEHFTIPANIASVTFIDQMHGWGWNKVQNTSSVPDSPTLFSTADGGKTWQEINSSQKESNTADPKSEQLPSGDGYFTFISQKKGWFVLNRIPTQPGSRTALYSTKDGGSTWQLQPLPLFSEPIPGLQTDATTTTLTTILKPTFFDDQHGSLSVFETEADQPNENLYLYSTTDGGQTWQPTGSKFIVSGKNITGTADAPVSLDSTNVALPMKNSISIYKLAGGQWQKAFTANVEGSPQSVNFIDAQNGWALMAKLATTNQPYQITTLYATHDGGKTWHKVIVSRVKFNNFFPFKG